jgi:glycosyltransferase involved in cell wall biosynthesis
MKDQKILIGVPPKAHVSLAMDEIEGLQDLGYECSVVSYGRNNQSVGIINKLFATTFKAIKIVQSLYRSKPAFLYLNSRFEPAGSTRDFISLFIVKMLYYKKLKVIIKSHGSDYTILLKQSFWFKNVVIPFLKNNVDGWFFLSNDEKKLIEHCDSNLASKVHVTPNIIDPSRCVASASFKDKYQLKEDKYKFLFVGRMVKVKGIFDIMNSIPLLDFRELCTFIFVGDGDDFAELKELAVSLKINHLVMFPGYLPDKECDHFYANADALIFPTYDTEGFPIALFKSVAVGLPVLTTRIRAAKDYLQEPDNVLWIKEKSPESIAGAARQLFNDKLLQKNMQENNKKLGAQFTKQKVSSLMSKVFQTL